MAQTRQQKHIMVVDDDPLARKIISAALEEAGYEVHTAENGRQCLDHVALSGSHLVLMDISMPDMDGMEACRQLKQTAGLEHLPVVFVTASTDDDTLQAAFEIGGTDYVRKPINRVELLARVRSALNLRAAVERQAEEEKLKAALETAGGVCHKLNQPLQYVLGAIQILMMDLGPEDPNYIQLAKVQKKVEQMGEITAKMAKITRYQTRAHAGGQHILDIDKCVEKPSETE